MMVKQEVTPNNGEAENDLAVAHPPAVSKAKEGKNCEKGGDQVMPH